MGNCTAPNLSGLFDWSPDGNNFSYVKKSKNNNETAIWSYSFDTKQHVQITEPVGINIFDTRPKYSPDGKKLGFTRGTQSIRNIYLKEINSQLEAKPITNSRSFITSFNWLNNTNYLVFDSNELGDRNLWLLDINNNKQELLGARDALYPSLNKNNSLLAFQEIRYNANIWSIDLTDNNSLPDRIIQSIKYNNFPVFSPDGKQIAFVSNRQGKSAIWLYSIETKKQTKLLAIPKLDLLTPNWSGDGRKLLVSSRGPDGYRCYQIDLENNELQVISAIKPAHYGCIYSDQGDIFAISKEPSEISKLLKLNLAGEVKALTKLGVARIQVTNFNRIIYSLTDEDGLYSMDFYGQNKRTILEGFSHKLDEHWAVQGAYLYYPKLDVKSSETSPETRGIWKRNLHSGEEEMVTKELPSAIGLTLNVNPAHSQLVISRTDSRVSDIYLAEITEKN